MLFFIVFVYVINSRLAISWNVEVFFCFQLINMKLVTVFFDKDFLEFLYIFGLPLFTLFCFLASHSLVWNTVIFQELKQ
jgi:hypothetical protein